MTVKPAPRIHCAYPGGNRNAKHRVLPGGHLVETVESVSTASRLPLTTSPRSCGRTASKKVRPPSGGRSGVEPMITSPTPATVVSADGLGVAVVPVALVVLGAALPGAGVLGGGRAGGGKTLPDRHPAVSAATASATVSVPRTACRRDLCTCATFLGPRCATGHRVMPTKRTALRLPRAGGSRHRARQRRGQGSLGQSRADALVSPGLRRTVTRRTHSDTQRIHPNR